LITSTTNGTGIGTRDHVMATVPVRTPATQMISHRCICRYVSAGQLGAEIAVNGAESNPIVLGLGVAATLGAITFAGKIADSALKDMDIDLMERS
jgi:hypothetical protein